MRDDTTMLSLLLDTARSDERIRAVWLNGSRADPNARRDRWMDFDAVFAVREVAPYRERGWIRRFGEIAVMQQPDDSPLFPDEPCFPERRHAWLMQFTDGTRIDLTILRLDEAEAEYGRDSATVLLLDKDSRFPPMKASDRDYWLQTSNAAIFTACCNEFWWVVPYVGKGLARSVLNPGEVLFARHALEMYVRPMLDRMLGWSVGCAEGFAQSLGKCMKRLPEHLSQERWTLYLSTFPSADREDVARALRTCCALFSQVCEEVASTLGFCINTEESLGSRAFLETLLAD